ncbi:hypothetical protein PIB30_105591, partial [Stylosanthes scabra]|nr:hypothetical protein [Stylosanthes scabra]
IIEATSEENRAERARANEAANVKFDAIRSSLTQLLQDRSWSLSLSMEHTHGSNSGFEFQPRFGLNRRVNFDLLKFMAQMLWGGFSLLISTLNFSESLMMSKSELQQFIWLGQLSHDSKCRNA